MTDPIACRRGNRYVDGLLSDARTVKSHGATVQGTASIEHDPNGLLIDDLSHKYMGGPYAGFAGPNPQWVTVRIAAQKVTTSWPD